MKGDGFPGPSGRAGGGQAQDLPLLPGVAGHELGHRLPGGDPPRQDLVDGGGDGEFHPQGFPQLDGRVGGGGPLSITMGLVLRTSAGDRPAPMARPARRFREWRLVAVATKSPRPERPLKVKGWAPRRKPSRVISASPRVMSAARVFSPKPRPSLMPHPNAMTFLRAPPSSTPTRSSLV